MARRLRRNYTVFPLFLLVFVMTTAYTRHLLTFSSFLF